MNTVAPNSLPSFVIIGSSMDLLGHHHDNLKDHFDSDSQNSTVTTLFASEDDSESCVSEFSESTCNSSTSYIIELSGKCDRKPQQQQGLPVGEVDETSMAKKLQVYRTKLVKQLQIYRTKRRGSGQLRMNVLLRRDRALRDSNYSSWSDKVLATMEDEDVDSVIVPLKGDDES